MANNVTLSAGTADGAVIATDDIGGVHYPYNKIGIGADDTFTILVGGTGVDAAGVLRVSLATNVALPAGSNAIGKLAANSGVDIGDVDILSIAAGDNNIGNVDIVSVPTDPFGANADAASATGSISAKLRFIAGTGIPITGTVTVGSHAVTNAGTFAVQVDGNALTSLQLLDDVVYAEDVGANSADKGVAILSKRVDTPNVALTNTDADWGHVTANKLGSIRVAALEDDLATAATTHVKKYYTVAGAVTDGIVWSPAAGARWFLTSLSFNVSAACTVTFEDDLAGGDVVVYKGEFAANSGAVITFPGVPMFSGEDAADLMVTTSAGNIYVTAVGYEI